jgi:antitoxin component of MazEF toxin-antitoxin module
MIKTLTKIGNSQGIIFDAALMDLARLKAGDKVNVEVHAGGAITLTPVRPRLSKEDFGTALDSVLKDYGDTLKKLA